MSSNNIPGWSTDLTPGQGPATTDGFTKHSALRELRPDGQSQKIYTNTYPASGVLGIQHQLPVDATITSSREGEVNTAGFKSITGSAVSISPMDSPVCGQDNSYPSSPTNSSSALQSTAVLMNSVAPVNYTQEGSIDQFNIMVQLDSES